MKTINIFLIIIISISSNCKQSHTSDFSDLDKSLNKKFASKFGFTVLIANQEGILWEKEYGGIEKGIKKNVDSKTLFNIASISKSITALGILKLIENNKLKLADKLDQFFDNVPNDKKEITIAHLLSHGAGFRQTYVCDGIENTQQAIDALLNDKLGSEPGSKFSYSNLNFTLLALIIEKVTKNSFEEYIKREIFTPLNMTNTYQWNEVYDISNIAGNSYYDFDTIRTRDIGFIGGAGLFSTSKDLFKFWDGIANNKLLRMKNNNLFFEINYKLNSGLGIGNGWFINENTDYGSKEFWTRGTESFGHNAVIRWFPEHDKVIIVCTNSGEIGNSSNTGNRLVSDFIVDYLLKK